MAARHVLIGALLPVTGLGAIPSGHGTWADTVGVAGGIMLLVAFTRSSRRTGLDEPTTQG